MLPRAIYNALVDGLQQLVALRLPGTPASETITATAAVWEAALETKRLRWCDEDVERVRMAFAHLAMHSKQWPMPIQFIECLPARPLLKALPHKMTAEERAENKQRIGNIIKTLAQAKKVKHQERKQP